MIATVLLPILSIFLYPLLFFIQKNIQKNRNSSGTSSLNILIPTTSDENTLPQTLDSLISNVEDAAKTFPDLRVIITVGIDEPKDSTRDVALIHSKQHPIIKIVDRGYSAGISVTMKELAKQSDTEWCAFVTSGEVWPNGFLIKAITTLKTTKHIGLIPRTTANPLEKFMKILENFSGGPVFASCNTVFFHTTELKESLKMLEKYPTLHWNIDLLTLCMRTYGKIKYSGNTLLIPILKPLLTSETGGLAPENRQWISKLFPTIVRKNTLVALVALRQVFKVYWLNDLILSGLCIWYFSSLEVQWLLAVVGLAIIIHEKKNNNISRFWNIII